MLMIRQKTLANTAAFGQFTARIENGNLAEVLIAWSEAGRQFTALLMALTLLAMDLRKCLKPAIWLIDNMPAIVESILDSCEAIWVAAYELWLDIVWLGRLELSYGRC